MQALRVAASEATVTEKTRVKLRREGFNPDQPHGTPHEKGERWPSGDLVWIFLPPEKPDAGWKCGCSHVWRMCPESAAEIGCSEGVYLCEHKIYAD